MSHKVIFAGSGDAFGSGGRLQTCIVVEAPSTRIAIDFGTTSLAALKRLEIPHNSIDAIVLTHLHGDHCGGIPFLLLDAMLGARRETPLTIAGPPGTRERLDEMAQVLFPGMQRMKPRFSLHYVEMESMIANRVVDGVSATPYPADHTPGTNPTSVRVEVEGKTIAYTGDGAWNEHIVTLARDADLLVAECYFREKPVRFHLNYPDLREHLDRLQAKRIVLTHMGPEMLAHADAIPEETAYDGLVIDL